MTTEPSAAASKEYHIRNLAILPPRQQHHDAFHKEDAVALPPLRAEEAVASLKAALVEIVGFGQLTKFRLVVEPADKKKDRSDVTVGAKVTKRSHQAAAAAAAGNNNKEEEEVPAPVSRYTLRHAVVSVPPSLRTLDGSRDGGDDGGDELVLDDYGDLSVLIDLLTPDESSDKVAAEEEGGSSCREKVVLDASSIAIRVVLERYDASSVKEQIGRVRALFAGNAPALKTLVAEAEAESTGLMGADGAAAVDGSIGENLQAEKHAAVDYVGAVAEEKKPTPEERAAKAKQQAEEACQQIARQLPQFPSDYDLTFSKATSGGDFTNFYHLACGEEMALITDGNGSGSSGGSNNNGMKSTAVEDWMNDGNNNNNNNGDAAKKKKRNQKKKKNNISVNSSNNNNSTSHNNTTNNSKSSTTLSIAETEQILYNLNNQTIIDATIRLSGHHPPPSHRRILGDLAYIECLIPNQPTIHVTAIPLGFYVNKSSSSSFNQVFDPTPAKEPCYSHTLLDCLLQKSQVLREAWIAALSASEKRAEVLKLASRSEDPFMQLYRPATSPYWNNHSGSSSGAGGWSIPSPSTFSTRLDGVTLRPAWLVPLPKVNGKTLSTWKQQSSGGGMMHKWNVGRAEEELTNMYGMDVKGGALRDWNEELQSARDMSVESFEERMDRARMIHKVLTDFSEAALHGVRAITEGHISPMNPNEIARSHVYLHNNIFFSRAVDAGLDTFKIIQGDRAAKKSASKEASNVGTIHRLDIKGLYTLGTVLVEYMGTRFICQSVVPGILHGDKAHTLAYGAVEALAELACDSEMHKVLEDGLGDACMVATRGVLSRPLVDGRVQAIKEYKSTLPLPLLAKEPEVKDDDGAVRVNNICGPIEMKGIIGSDQRKYVLDCTRLTPRDANWVSKAHGGTGYWEEAALTGELIPADLDDDEWTAAVLRPELVATYANEKLKGFLIAMQAREAEKPSNATKTVAKDDSASDQVESSNAGDKDKEEWVDVEKTDEKVDADVEKMRQEEAEYIKTLRFNVNVFLPYMKSIESIDKDAYEQLQKDEEEARKLAGYLWNTVIPNVTKNIRLDSCKTVQIPTDGQSLTEFLHARGINCRYLGRLADLARIEEQKDIDAEKAYENNKKENKLPRFRMPLCWLELLECEMVARAAKHVLDSYLTENGGTAAAQPAQTIASLLSAVVSNGEEASSETELRTAVGGEDVINADEINALTLFGVGGCGDAVHKPVRGRIEIWSDIEKEIGRRYRYTLSLYNKGKHNSRALYPSLLRRICQRSGIRIVAKSYDIGKKCVCGGGSNSAGRLDYSYPIAAVDILDVLPMVKHAASSGEEDSFFPCRFDSTNTSSLHIVFSDAKALSEGAIRHLNAGNVGHALEFAQEAAHLYQRVVDSPLHVQVAKNIHLMSKCQIVGQDNEAAIQSTLKYLAVAVSIGGFDCKEALDAHNQLSDLYFAVGQVKEAIKHIRALSYLMEFSAGGNFSQLSAIYYKLGIQYYEGSKLSDALTFYDVAQKKRSDDRFVDSIIASSSALALGRLGKFSDASTQEKIAYQLNLALLGEEHDRTKMSSSSLLQFMRLAMEQGRVAAAQKNKHTREIEANAIAESIKAEEDRAESAAKKKKKKKKGSKSGNTSENENSPENVAQKNVSKAA